jgi:hypothetical protein
MRHGRKVALKEERVGRVCQRQSTQENFVQTISTQREEFLG